MKRTLFFGYLFVLVSVFLVSFYTSFLINFWDEGFSTQTVLWKTRDWTVQVKARKDQTAQQAFDLLSMEYRDLSLLFSYPDKALFRSANNNLYVDYRGFLFAHDTLALRLDFQLELLFLEQDNQLIIQPVWPEESPLGVRITGTTLEWVFPFLFKKGMWKVLESSREAGVNRLLLASDVNRLELLSSNLIHFDALRSQLTLTISKGQHNELSLRYLHPLEFVEEEETQRLSLQTQKEEQGEIPMRETNQKLVENSQASTPQEKTHSPSSESFLQRGWDWVKRAFLPSRDPEPQDKYLSLQDWLAQQKGQEMLRGWENFSFSQTLVQLYEPYLQEVYEHLIEGSVSAAEIPEPVLMLLLSRSIAQQDWREQRNLRFLIRKAETYQPSFFMSVFLFLLPSLENSGLS